jgi:hypothetical protein
LLPLFASTLFVSATLLFWIQPMIARMLVPLLGGTPAVWNTCMLFFQTMLLAGYGYAHLVASRLGLRKQIALHITLLCIAALFLPLGISESAIRSLPTESNPSFWLLRSLFSAAGLPFFIASTTAPLLQKWFSNTRHRSAKDPYFLYAASNAGSLIALLGYPLLMEPNLRLQEQSWLWAATYAVFASLVLLCAIVAGRIDRASSGLPPKHGPPDDSTSVAGAVAPISFRERLRWTGLACVPSSLMLGVTTYITTDIASIPLLWVLPLSIYLITFILAFGNRRIISMKLIIRALPIGAVGLSYLILSEATEPPWLLIILHLLVFFIAAMACHGQLAGARPPTRHLTEFYLWISVGGVVGGIFNAIIAPALFTGVLEYPIAFILACVLSASKPVAIAPHPPSGHPLPIGWGEGRGEGASEVQGPGAVTKAYAILPAMPPRSPRKASHRRELFLDLIFPLGVGLLTALLMLTTPRFGEWPIQLRLALMFGLPAIICYVMVDRPVRFGLALGAVILAGLFYSGTHGRILHAERNFFGVLRVTTDATGTFHRLIHGNTVHGRQFIGPARRCEPLSYYHKTGPLGQIFDVFQAKPKSSTIAVVGLGAGSMACYATARQTWTFYEINPAVIRLALDTNYFTFVKECSSAKTEMVAGDARLQLRNAPNGSYDLIVLDAFSSDAIPVHLITREALDIYLSKLATGGMIAFHISNRCLSLEPVLGALAMSAHLVCHGNDENEPSSAEQADGKDQSHWVIMARQREDLGKLAKDARWAPVSAPKNARIWTDDFSDILSVFKWE